MYEYLYDFSAYNKWSIDFIQLADDIPQFDYPEINYISKNDDNNYIKNNFSYYYYCKYFNLEM